MRSKNPQVSPLVTLGWIDSMSITQAVQAFEVHPNLSSPLGWQIPANVTMLLLETTNIGLAPGLSGNTILSSGPIGFLTRELTNSRILIRPPFEFEIKKNAMAKTKRRLYRFRTRLLKEYQILNEKNKDSVYSWMDWSIRSAWMEHAQNFNGLIDREFERQLALFLDIPIKDLQRVRELTTNPQRVQEYVKSRPNSEDFRITYECFLLGALIRGLYHYYLATGSRNQINPHPFREIFLPHEGTNSSVFTVGNTLVYLTNIILNSAISEVGLKGRLHRWVSNINRIKGKNIPGNEEIDLRPKEDPELAKKEAVRAAKAIEIDVHPEWVEVAIDVTLNVGVTVGGFILTPFAGAGLGLGYYAADKRFHIGRAATRGIYGVFKPLSKLAESPPGRLAKY